MLPLRTAKRNDMEERVAEARGQDQAQVLRRALEEDTEILRRRRTELMALRTALASGPENALQDREIYLVGSIKRIEEQIAALKNALNG